MKIVNQAQAANTRLKLAALEAHYEKARQREMETAELHQLTLFSLRRSINELKEELIRFECDLKAGRVETEASI